MEKISAVLIVKNEQKVLARCLKSLSGCDEIVILDTGSTDKTVSIAKEMGAKVHCVPPKEAFHFAHARNTAHDLAANDWILAIDADEVLRAGMLGKIRTAIKEWTNKADLEKATAFSITFTDRGAVTHKKKIYRKSVWNWKHRVHEELVPLGTDAKEVALESVVMDHLPTIDKKIRHGQNIELLRMTVAEEPEYTRAWKYLGQELMLDKAYQEAIPFLAHYVEKTADGALDKSEVMMRIGECYAETRMMKEACEWFDYSAGADPRRREPLYHAARYLLSLNPMSFGDLVNAGNFARRCASIPASSKPGSHLDNPNVWGNQPAKMMAFCQEEIAKVSQARV